MWHEWIVWIDNYIDFYAFIDGVCTTLIKKISNAA